MKMLICGLTMSLSVLASTAQAEVTLNVDGESIPLSTLMDNCKSISGSAEAQISCFNALTQMLDEQSGSAPAETGASVTDALDALRDVAQYQDGETGLTITGSDRSVQITYFANYFHISRRNISTIDLFSAQFDASQLEYDQTAAARGASAPLSKGIMDAGATAAMWGGVGLESAQQNFDPKSPRTSLDVYADEVVAQLPSREDAAFDFVLVHPQRSDASDDIWSAFEAFVSACKG